VDSCLQFEITSAPCVVLGSKSNGTGFGFAASEGCFACYYQSSGIINVSQFDQHTALWGYLIGRVGLRGEQT
jgi:hypothetical protein